MRVKFLIEAYLRQQNIRNYDQNHESQLNGIIANYFNIGGCTEIIDDGVHKRPCKNIACNYCIFGKQPKCNGHIFGVRHIWETPAPVYCSITQHIHY